MIRANADRPSSESEPAPPAAAPSASVLVVKGGSSDADDLERRLGALGFSVDVAPDLGEAVERACRDRPDAVVLVLEAGAAPSLFRAARKITKRSGAAVVFLTDETPEYVLRSPEAAGAFGYVLRPFSDGQLDLSIRTALAAARREARRAAKRRKLKRRLRLLKGRVAILEAVFDVVPDALFATDHEAVLVMANQSSGPFLRESTMGGAMGMPREFEIYAVDGTTPMAWDDLPLPRALRGVPTDDQEILVTSVETSEARYFSVSGRPLLTGGKDKPGAVILVRDVTAVRKAEEELRSSVDEMRRRTRLLEAVLESMRDGVLATDDNGNPLVWNSGFRRIMGTIRQSWDSKAVLGEDNLDAVVGARPPKSWREEFGIYLPDKETLLPQDQSPLLGALEGRETNGLRLFIRNSWRPEGVPVSVAARPLVGFFKERKAALLVIHDLTEGERLQVELEATAERLKGRTHLMQTLLESLNVGVVAADLEGNFTIFNRAAENLTGKRALASSPDEWTREFGVFLPDGKTPFPTGQLPLVRAIRGEPTDGVEMVIRNEKRPGGVLLSTSGRPLQPTAGGVTGGVVVFDDIGPQREAELKLRTAMDELREQTELMEEAFDAVREGILVTDSSGRVLYVNKGAADVLALEENERLVPGDPLLKRLRAADSARGRFGVFDPDTTKPLAAADLPSFRAVRGESTLDKDLLVRTPLAPDGVVIRANGRPLLDADGGVRGGVVIFRDVTSDLRADEALARAFAEGRLEMVDTILHNVGNAISSVVVGAETIAEAFEGDPLVRRLSSLADAVAARKGDWPDYVASDPQGRKVLPFVLEFARDLKRRDGDLRATARRVRDRAAHIADIVRTQRSLGNMAAGQTDVHIARSVQATVRLLRDSFERRGIAVEVDCRKAPRRIRVHASQFHQMLLNLLKNAMESIEERLEAGGFDERPLIRVTAARAGNRLILSVRDNGIGHEEGQRRLFAAGYTTKEGGSGLGLHSTANFVAGSGGTVELRSEGRGRGALARVVLPLPPGRNRGAEAVGE